jgi:hypothetical protein
MSSDRQERKYPTNGFEGFITESRNAQSSTEPRPRLVIAANSLHLISFCRRNEQTFFEEK